MVLVRQYETQRNHLAGDKESDSATAKCEWENARGWFKS